MRRLITALFFVLFAANTLSQEAEKQAPADDGFQWEVMLELALVYNPTALKVAELDDFWNFIGGGAYVDLSYKGFFFQTNRFRANAFSGELGYQLIEQDNWGVDLIAKVYLFGFDPESIERYNDTKTPGFELLEERNPGVGLALRYSYFNDDDIFTADLATLNPALGGNSWVVDLYYSHLSVYKNWDIYTGAGLTYYSQDVVNYYAGVTADESSKNFAPYQAGDGFKAEAQIFGLYPLSRNWTLSVGVTQSYLSSSFSDSSIGLRQDLTQLKLGARYVF